MFIIQRSSSASLSASLPRTSGSPAPARRTMHSEHQSFAKRHFTKQFLPSLYQSHPCRTPSGASDPYRSSPSERTQPMWRGLQWRSNGGITIGNFLLRGLDNEVTHPNLGLQILQELHIAYCLIQLLDILNGGQIGLRHIVPSIHAVTRLLPRIVLQTRLNTLNRLDHQTRRGWHIRRLSLITLVLVVLVINKMKSVVPWLLRKWVLSVQPKSLLLLEVDSFFLLKPLTSCTTVLGFIRDIIGRVWTHGLGGTEEFVWNGGKEAEVLYSRRNPFLGEGGSHVLRIISRPGSLRKSRYSKRIPCSFQKKSRRSACLGYGRLLIV